MSSGPLIDVVRGRQDPASIDHLLRSLPDWFAIEESIRDYVEDAAVLPTLLAVDAVDGTVVGALLLRRHPTSSGEIHLLAVAPDRHRQGIGRRLVEEAERDLRADSVPLVHVKTQGPSLPDADYAATLAFYLALGYLPLEELHGYWPDVPCLILVKQL